MTRGGEVELVRLDASHAQGIVQIFCDAFRDYPVMRYVVGSQGPYMSRLETLIHFFVSARVLRGEPLLGVVRGDTLVAAATTSHPEGESPPELNEVRESAWTTLGDESCQRYEACGRAWKTLEVASPHLHLNMIGVRRDAQGEGHAWRLLQEVHALARDVPEYQGVTLTTEDPRNVAYYERAGYQVVGHVRISPELESWGFFRPVGPDPGPRG